MLASVFVIFATVGVFDVFVVLLIIGAPAVVLVDVVVSVPFTVEFPFTILSADVFNCVDIEDKTLFNFEVFFVCACAW